MTCVAARLARYFGIILNVKGNVGLNKWNKWTALVVSIGMVFAVICCGRIVCLCSDDPDGCGDSCHVCGGEAKGGLSADAPCSHVFLCGVDFWSEDGTVATAAYGGDSSSACVLSLCAVSCGQDIMPIAAAKCANAPPGSCSDSVLFRARRILLLS